MRIEDEQHEQKLLDIENFYATATPEQALEYFKNAMTKGMAAISRSLDRAEAAISRIRTKLAVVSKGIMSRFGKRQIRENVYLGQPMVYVKDLSDPRTRELLEGLDDEIAQEELLSQALAILISKNHKK